MPKFNQINSKKLIDQLGLFLDFSEEGSSTEQHLSTHDLLVWSDMVARLIAWLAIENKASRRQLDFNSSSLSDLQFAASTQLTDVLLCSLRHEEK